MPFESRSCALPLLAALALVAACGGDDDGGTGPDIGGELTRQESVEMLEALAAVGSFSAPGFDSSGSDPYGAAAADPVNFDFDDTAPCPEGGSVQVSGNVNGDVDQETGAADLTFTMVQTHVDCVGTSDSGRTFTFDGAPNLTTDMNFTSAADQSVTIDGTQQGTLAWETEGKSGTCDFDLTFDLSGGQDSFSGSVKGAVCGFSVDRTIDVG